MPTMTDAEDEMYELTDTEENWVRKWSKLVSKMPDPLLLLVNAASAGGDVEVLLPDHIEEESRHSRWANRLIKHLKDFPAGDAWLLSNIEGWHFGKGTVTVVSSSSYGPNGACSSHSDDYSDHYLKSIPIDYGCTPEGYRCISVLPSNQGNREAVLVVQ